MRRALVLLAICAGVLALPTTVATAGETLSLDLVSPVEPLTFRAELNGGSCDPGSMDIDSVEANGDPVTPVSVTQDPTDDNVMFIVLPSATPAGDVAVDASCIDGEFPLSGSQDIEWAAIGITKTVDGIAPAGATYTVHVSCDGGSLPASSDFSSQSLPDSFTADLGYTASGEVKYVYSDHPADCTITEPVNGGADHVKIDPEVVSLVAPTDFTSTVTNVFDPAVEIIELQPAFTG